MPARHSTPLTNITTRTLVSDLPPLKTAAPKSIDSPKNRSQANKASANVTEGHRHGRETNQESDLRVVGSMRRITTRSTKWRLQVTPARRTIKPRAARLQLLASRAARTCTDAIVM